MGMALIFLAVTEAFSQIPYATRPINQDKFRQLEGELPTPNRYRSGSGAPGPDYWQNRADYVMNITLDDTRQRIDGTETITYFNQSPDALPYLWLQLDQNLFSQTSETPLVEPGTIDNNRMTFDALQRKYDREAFDGGFHINHVKDATGKPLSYTIVKTMMRVDLPQPLLPGQSVVFSVGWWHNVNDRMKVGGRSGYEYFPEDGNYLYTIAQFFPRMCVYTDYTGWQHKQFLGRGEFTLAFGNYRVNLTVPADHVVGATGVLQNASQVLSKAQRDRLEKAKTAADPVMIVSPEEALEAEKSKATATKTWTFYAENVRDFAFASSRKFIWDAMGVDMEGKQVMAMSYYPKEGNPLWERYSTRVVAHTLKVYSRYTFPYPYPVAISVHTDQIGMEYPMICFNGGRPEKDGTYSERTKYGMIGVIIHEVGHNYFPMIVNSDERQWTWMDEGLNTFLQYLTEVEWERDYPVRRGPAANIAEYMRSDPSQLEPIMTNSESIRQFGNNAYAKTATGLNILRETIMGRELFDYAFKTYSRRWMFKHPNPADFFRSMEDASGIDLDWFWRGWFFTVDPVDISLESVAWYQVDTRNPAVEKPIAQAQKEAQPQAIGAIRNAEAIEQTVMEVRPDLQDFYNKWNRFEVTAGDQQRYQRYVDSLSVSEKALLGVTDHFYELTFANKGGLVMPIILEFTYADQSKEVFRIPAEIWRMNPDQVSKLFITKKPVVSITLDPFLETADIDTDNNYWPPRVTPSRFQLYKEKYYNPNPMRQSTRP
jgi:hypothetical protein